MSNNPTHVNLLNISSLFNGRISTDMFELHADTFYIGIVSKQFVGSYYK